MAAGSSTALVVLAAVQQQGTSPTIPDWISAIAGGIGGMAGFAALAITLVRQARSRKVPPPELRVLLHDLYEAFDAIISGGGQPRGWFDTPERRRQQLSLASYATLLVDDELNKHVGNARYAYIECQELAADPAQQVPRAEEGCSHLNRAITRMGKLVRKRGAPIG